MQFGTARGEIALLLILTLFSQPLPAQDSEAVVSDYISPNFKAMVIDPEQLTREDITVVRSMATALIKFAINLPATSDDHAKAIALAWGGVRDRSVSEAVIKADFYLRLGEYPKGDPFFRGAPSMYSLEEAASEIARASRALSTSESDAGQTYGSYCEDLIFNTPTLPAKFAADGGFKSEVDWSHLIAGEASAGGVSDEVMAVGATEDVKRFAKRQSLIKGLLVMDLGASEVAGEASQMNATVQDGRRMTDPTTFRFNQSVGGDMRSALNEVKKYLTVKHEGFPKGKVIEIAFEEQYSNKDGPSAAVACSLMLDSLLTGADLDSKFAVTGDMNADGAVQPVGGIEGKVRGATNRDCTHIAIPRKNASSLVDWIVLDDVKPLVNIQVFSIGDFNEASSLAMPPEKRDETLQKAIATFAEVQKVLQRPNGMSYLKNSHVRGRLQEVLQAAPNHESAKLLLLYGSGQAPATLSLMGSFNQIDRVTRPIMEVLETGDIESSAEGLNNSMFALRRVRGQLDQRAREASDALEDLSGILKQLGETKTDRSSPRYRELFKEFTLRLEKVKTAYNSLASNAEIQEELIQ